MATGTNDLRNNLNDPNAFDIDEHFRRYFYTDNLPEEDVISKIHSVLGSLYDQRRVIKRSIDVLNITLEALRRSHDNLDRVIYSYKTLLSPIRRLPDDVLGEIFLQTLPSTRNPFPTQSDLPFLLTLVSKRWRSIARATPRLWSKLHIVIPPSQFSGGDEILRRRSSSYVSSVKTWLNLSGDVPLSLSISSSKSRWCDDDTSPLVEDLLLFIIQQSPRWKEIELVCSSEVMHFIHKSMGTNGGEQRKLPLLRQLRLQYRDNTPESEDFTAFHRYLARSLNVLSLDFCSVPAYSSLFPMLREAVNWASLTQLSLHRCVVGDWWSFEILQQCQQLEALVLDVSGHNPEQAQDRTRICIPKLKALSIRGGYNDDSNMCQYLETPLLTHFSFYPTGYKFDYFDDPGLNPLTDFLARCSMIQSLTLSPDKFTPRDLISLLEAVPGINSLILDHSDSPLIWMDEGSKSPHHYRSIVNFPLKPFLLQGSGTSQYSATSSPPLQPLLPNLQSFSILCLSTPPENAELILSFCKSRLSQPLSANATADTDPPFALLNHIKMRLSKLESTLDIGHHLHLHAESVGRVIGDDLVLDITYPWGAEDPWVPSIALDPRKGIDKKTNRTWYTIEAGDLQY